MGAHLTLVILDGCGSSILYLSANSSGPKKALLSLCFDNALHNFATNILQIVHWALSKGSQIYIIGNNEIGCLAWTCLACVEIGVGQTSAEGLRVV